MDDAAPSAGLDVRFQSLVDNIPGIVVYLDRVQPDDPSCSLPIYISPQIEDLLGYERAAWLNEDELWLDVLHPDDRERMVEADAHARGTLSSLFAEYRMIARDGRVVWVSEKATVVVDETTGTSYWQGVMLDITDRKQAEEALAASERQYRSVFDAATIGLLKLDLTGRVLEANQVAEHVLGYPAGALVGVGLWARIAAEDQTVPLLDEIARGTEDRWELEHRLLRHDGAPLWCRTVTVLVRDRSGEPEHVTVMVEDIDERKQVEAKLVHQTTHDALTMLPNRQHFYDELQRARARGDDAGIAVVFIDIDTFKQVNDAFGHDCGDELLVAVARRLRGAVRPSDVVARFGGDEFLVLANGLDAGRDAAQLAWRLVNALRAPFSVAGEEVAVTASFGVAYSDDPTEPDEDLVRKADAAMYSAKQRGRNRVSVFGEPDTAEAVA